MAIAIWFLDFVAYMAYMIYFFGRPPDLHLGIGIGALIVGFVGLAIDKKLILLLSFLMLFFGVVMTYKLAYDRGIIYIWAGAMVAMLFFGSLALREA